MSHAISILETDNNGFLQLGPDGVFRSFSFDRSDTGELTVIDYLQVDPQQIQQWYNDTTRIYHPGAPKRHPGRVSSGRRRSPARTGKKMAGEIVQSSHPRVSSSLSPTSLAICCQPRVVRCCGSVKMVRFSYSN